MTQFSVQRDGKILKFVPQPGTNLTPEDFKLSLGGFFYNLSSSKGNLSVVSLGTDNRSVEAKSRSEGGVLTFYFVDNNKKDLVRTNFKVSVDVASVSVDVASVSVSTPAQTDPQPQTEASTGDNNNISIDNSVTPTITPRSSGRDLRSLFKNRI